MPETVDQPRRVEYLRLDEIQRAPRNPKRHDTDAINASIDEHGLAELPLFDERTGRLVAGHGRFGELETMRACGHPAPDGVLVDADGMWKMPVVRGWASKSDAHAEAYLLASNQTAMRGGWHDDSLTAVLADIAETDFDLALVAGWNPDQLADLLALTEMAPPTFEPVDIAAPHEAHGDQPAPTRPAAPELAPSPVVKVREAAPAPAAPSGQVEMILIYTENDRSEVGRLINAARQTLGGELKAAELILRALRTMVNVLDYRDAGTVDMATLARAAGWKQ